jgi:hypothetical protein
MCKAWPKTAGEWSPAARNSGPVGYRARSSQGDSRRQNRFRGNPGAGGLIIPAMNTSAPIFAVVLALLAASPWPCLAAAKDMEILGWVEYAKLPALDLELKAKLDTGAETSSLDARIIKKFRKDGKRWVRFAVIDREHGEEHVLVRERVRTIGVVQHGRLHRRSADGNRCQPDRPQ